MAPLWGLCNESHKPALKCVSMHEIEAHTLATSLCCSDSITPMSMIGADMIDMNGIMLHTSISRNNSKSTCCQFRSAWRWWLNRRRWCLNTGITGRRSGCHLWWRKSRLQCFFFAPSAARHLAQSRNKHTLTHHCSKSQTKTKNSPNHYASEEESLQCMDCS